MSSTLDASLDDPAAEMTAEAEARRLHADRCDRAVYYRRQAKLTRSAADQLDLLADRLDPPHPLQVPFGLVPIGAHVWLEDEWHTVIAKETLTDDDGQTFRLRARPADRPGFADWHPIDGAVPLTIRDAF